MGLQSLLLRVRVPDAVGESHIDFQPVEVIAHRRVDVRGLVFDLDAFMVLDLGGLDEIERRLVDIAEAHLALHFLEGPQGLAVDFDVGDGVYGPHAEADHQVEVLLV